MGYSSGKAKCSSVDAVGTSTPAELKQGLHPGRPVLGRERATGGLLDLLLGVGSDL
jgi:hypothetical protein